MFSKPQGQSLSAMIHFSFTLILYLCFAPTSLAMNVANVLIYSYTAGYRHESIPTAVASMTSLGPSYGINFVNTEDPAKITDDYLSQFDALFFLSNTDQVLTLTGQVAFQNYLDKGGNFIAVHSASECQSGWITIVDAIGAGFAYHPEFTNATMVVSEIHPSTAGLPHRWNVSDEIYNFDRDPRALGAVVVLTADETTYNDPGARNTGQGDPHPITWYQESNKGTNSTPAGRSWYTGLGHAAAAWQDELFLGHIFGGVTWTLASNTTRAMNPDGLVGSDGPEWTPPSAGPTETDGTSEDSPRGSASSKHANLMIGALSMTLAGLIASMI